MTATSSYQSNFPDNLYGGNLQSERITDDADILARARDYNIHDREIVAIQQGIGEFPEGTEPTGTIQRRLYDLEHGGSVHDRVHDLDGSDHTGILSLTKVKVDITSVLGNTINNWMVKMNGTGDLDGDGLTSIQDVIAGLAMNKEVLDDLILVGFDYPWQVPTGGGPGKPGGPGIPPGGGLPVPGSGGGFDPTDPALPTDEIWVGLGQDVSGTYDQPVGLLVDFSTGEQYGVQKYRNPAGGAVLTGLRTISDIGFADVWGTPGAGNNYGLFYFRKPSTTGITNDSGVLTNSVGGLVVESKQVDATTTDEIVSLNFGDNVFDVPISPDLGANVTRSGWDGVDAVEVGWCHVIDTPTGDGTVPARIVAPDTGTITIAVVTSSPAANAGAQVWNTSIDYKVGRAAKTTVAKNITAAVVVDTPQRDDIVAGLAITKDDILNINFNGLNTSPYNQKIVLHSIIIEYTVLG